LWIADVRRVRKEAPERDRIIQRTARQDGSEVIVAIEGGGRQKDLPNHMKELLSGLTAVKETQPSKDKVVRATPLEPLFESGRVHVQQAEWNDAWAAELRAFPGGKHDDQVDSLTVGLEVLKNRPKPNQDRYESVQRTRDYGGLI
jgi:predicted phage terminase large subunit-like protein